MRAENATAASVSSQLTDEQIESIAESLEHDAENLYGDNTPLFMADENNAAAVLRNYVRLRKLVNSVKAKTDEILRSEDIDGPFELATGDGPMWIRDTSNGMQGPAVLTAVDALNALVEIKRLLAEAKKGESE